MKSMRSPDRGHPFVISSGHIIKAFKPQPVPYCPQNLTGR
ncbi:unnamed protein product [Rodentolepis nana]|uniref:Uncharacterized protein n=1 Tax=Rodentolepis nana TaxID=102285 RepID=A0A0R3TDX4_RODNA|nr:unnamed protein product [Rodentolepis nana]